MGIKWPEVRSLVVRERVENEPDRRIAGKRDIPGGFKASELTAEHVHTEIGKFEVKQARFLKKGTDGSMSAMIELTLLNQTPVAVFPGYFVARLKSHGQAKPWATGVFCKGSPGGINPGEVRGLTLMPFETVWDLIDPPAETVLTVSITRLDGEDGRALFDVGAGGELALKSDTPRLRAFEDSRDSTEGVAQGQGVPKSPDGGFR